MKLLLCTLGLLAFSSATAGPLADQFRGGFEGVSWGTSVAGVVNVLADGEHVFSTAPGRRSYRIEDDREVFGVHRSGHTIMYHFGARDELVGVSVNFPYDRKEELLGALMAHFGTYARVKGVGSVDLYLWREDEGIQINVEATKSERHGMLRLSVYGPKGWPPPQWQPKR